MRVRLRSLFLLASSSLALTGCPRLHSKSPETTTIAAPADADNVTILVGRVTFLVPRRAALTAGGANYNGYLFDYVPLNGKTLAETLQARFDERNGPDNQKPRLELDPARHRGVLTYGTGDSTRFMTMWQDLGNGGAMTLQADYYPLGEFTARAALTALMDDVVPVQPGQPIPTGLGLPGSVLRRPYLQGEVANTTLLVPMPGYDPIYFSGFSLEMVSTLRVDGSDDLRATCRNGQLSQHDAGEQMRLPGPDPFIRTPLRYGERIVAGLPGGETGDDLVFREQTSSREATLTFETDAAFPPPGHPIITARATNQGLRADTSLAPMLAIWDRAMSSATQTPIPAGFNPGFFGRPPPGFKELRPCHAHPTATEPPITWVAPDSP